MNCNGSHCRISDRSHQCCVLILLLSLSALMPSGAPAQSGQDTLPGRSMAPGDSGAPNVAKGPDTPNVPSGSAEPGTPVVPSTCNRGDFRPVIDVGHTRKNYGALSAHDKPEFDFNLRLADELLAKLKDTGFFRAIRMVQADSDLIKRARNVSQANPNLVLSLHHDSVQDQFLKHDFVDGAMRTFTTYARGYSTFVSRDNSHQDESRQFAEFLGHELLKQRLKPNMSHSEKIPGENRPVLDADAGVFFYDHLVILRQVTAPAALLESAVITNLEDEGQANDPAYRARIISGIVAAVDLFCGATSDRIRQAVPPSVK
jgi:N-acetylmuramoyl-L-alanine amidase